MEDFGFKGPEAFSDEQVEAFKKKHGPFSADEPDPTSDSEIRELMSKNIEFLNDPATKLISTKLSENVVVPSNSKLRQN